MPFKSRSQMRKAFATNGFGGKIDPEEWAKKTPKKIPERVKSKRTKSKPRHPREGYKDLTYTSDLS